MARKIAFPDAPGSWGELFTEERLSRLNSIDEFSLNFCDSYPQTDLLIERIGDAKGVISAWESATTSYKPYPNSKSFRSWAWVLPVFSIWPRQVTEGLP